MAEDKKSFILHTDTWQTVKKLPNEKAGELFKLILSYVNDEHPSTDDLLLQIAFEPIKQSLKREFEKWEEERKKRSEAGKKGMESRWKDHNNDNTVITNDKSVINGLTKISDSVSVSVSDSVIKEKRIKKNGIDDGSFDTFYNLYDNKVGREEAVKAWSKLSPIEREVIISTVKLWREAYGNDYLPNPATWLNQKRWTDDIAALKKNRSSQGRNGHHVEPVTDDGYRVLGR